MTLVDHLNNWLSFAVSSRTKRLAFDLVPKELRGRDDRYAFPFERLKGESTLHLQCIQLSFVPFKLSSQLLSIVRCHLNGELKLEHPFSHLQYLQVAHCRITKIELYAAKLKTFIYRGLKLPIDLRQCQELETACLFHLDMTFEDALTVLPCLIPSV
uniref:Uncharacterized protein n=1 Tax=Arundo donax TaxID=35708 RepID=A0A0A9H406_ARUDO